MRHALWKHWFAMILGMASALAQPPIGVPVPPLGNGPFILDTAEQHKIRVTVFTKGLSHPWSLAFLPDGSMLMTERPGRLRVIRDAMRDAKLDPRPISGVPAVLTMGNSGLMDLALHPKFAENKLVYFTYNKPGNASSHNKQVSTVLARARLDGGALTDVRDIFVAYWLPEDANGYNSRIVFGRDGMIYVSNGASNSDAAQDPKSHRGKIMRLRDDGTVPPDNPFVGKPGARPEIYTLGHRDHFGIAPHPVTGQMFHVELGPYGGDKINILKAGGDYGWPDYSYGRNNDSSPIANPNVPGIEPALLVWVPGITPSGLLFYTGDKFPAWKGNLMVGSVVRGRVNGATGIERVVFNDKMWETRRETFLGELKQRMRDIRQGSDGLIYLLTEEVDGAVLKLEPAD